MIIGLYMKHIKAYKGINFIPIGSKYNFISYIGENGVGKSSILESLDALLNGKTYPINKSASADGISTKNNEPFVVPIFLIKKDRVSRQKKEFEILSNFFWTISEQAIKSRIKDSMKDFFKIREELKTEGKSSDDYYLIVMGEIILPKGISPYFASFTGDENFLTALSKSEEKPKEDMIQQRKWVTVLKELKNLYSYVYLPVEMNLENFTKIETVEMQKIFDKELKMEIETFLSNVNLNRADGINKKLDCFLSEIQKILDGKYCYRTGQSRNNTLTKSDLVEKILEVYFHKRTLYKIDDNIEKKVTELSAGEKRQTLIDLLYAFLKRAAKREKFIIIGIDEPENSLHTSLCYEQFEKLKEISANNQILITTHWYGFLPIVSQGYAHFLECNDNKISFSTYDLYDYMSQINLNVQNRVHMNFELKSINDLVQSIYHSITRKNPYNWIICEGISEKIYFNYFFKKEISENTLKILPMGGQSKVINIFKYLEVPIVNELKNETDYGKVFCLIDTDNTRCSFIPKNNTNKNLSLKRLSNKNNNETTELLNVDHNDSTVTDIEQSLNPIIFKTCIENLSDNPEYKINCIKCENGNSAFIKNFENYRLENFFKENSGNNKIIFANEYVRLMDKENNLEKTPGWINRIKEFFKLL